MLDVNLLHDPERTVCVLLLLSKSRLADRNFLPGSSLGADVVFDEVLPWCCW